jgi:hypothetical protein
MKYSDRKRSVGRAGPCRGTSFGRVLEGRFCVAYVTGDISVWRNSRRYKPGEHKKLHRSVWPGDTGQRRRGKWAEEAQEEKREELMGSATDGT